MIRAHTSRLHLETLEAREQPGSLLAAPLAVAPWLGLDLGLAPPAPAATSARLRLPSGERETLTSVSLVNTPPAVAPPAPVAAAAPAAVQTPAATDSLLLTAASVTPPAAEPQFATATIDTAEDGLANPHPGYRSLVFRGVGGRTGPVADYATYFGGAGYDEIRAVVLGPQGEMYLAGMTDTGDPDQGVDAFVVKLDGSGQVVYGILFGGVGLDEANGLDVDRAGNAYVSGTFVNQFGLTNGYVQKLNADGDRVLWRRNVPGAPEPNGVNISFSGLRLSAAQDQVYYSGTIDNANGIFGGAGRVNAADGSPIDAFLIRGLRYTNPVRDVRATALGLDRDNNAYVANHSYNTETGDIQWAIFRMSSADLSFTWNRLYQVPGTNIPLAIAADADGNSYAVGYATDAFGLITFQQMKHAPNGDRIYQFRGPVVEGSLYSEGNGVAVDAQGRSYVAGTYLTKGGDENTFLTRITARPMGKGFEFDLDTLTFGGSGNDPARALAAQLDPALATYAGVAGLTTSAADFPVTADAAQPVYGGGDSDGFVARTRLPGA